MASGFVYLGFNIDHGSQFTRRVSECGGAPADRDQHGRPGLRRENVFVEQLWRPLKYEDVYLNGYETLSDVLSGHMRYFAFFNQRVSYGGLRSRTADQEPGSSLLGLAIQWPVVF